MTAKNYLFAAVASALFLLLVVPLLSAPAWTSDQAVSIASLSIFSVSVGGTVAETFEIATVRGSILGSLSNARRYFLSVACSTLFYVVAAPSITLAFSSNTVVNLASASALLALSLGIGGLATDGFFALFKIPSTFDVPNRTEKGEISQHASPTEDGVVDALLGKRSVVK